MADIDVFCAGEKCGKQCDEGFQHGYLEYHHWARKDAHGLFTGFYCDECYESGDSSKYPYRKDDYYDPMYAGERMEPEDSLPWEY